MEVSHMDFVTSKRIALTVDVSTTRLRLARSARSFKLQ